jgi:nucleoid DNA-binding protein
MVPAKLVPVFKPSKELRSTISGPVETPEPVAT